MLQMFLALVQTLLHLQTVEAMHSCHKILPQYNVSDETLANAVNFHYHGGSLAVQQKVWDHGSLSHFDGRFMPSNLELPLKRQPNDKRSCWVDNTILPKRKSCLFDVLGPIVAHCRSPMSSFGTGDEEKRFCLHGSRERQPFLVSIGSNDLWDFETAVLSTGKFKRVHVFDCTLGGDGQPKRMPQSLANRVTFYPWCLAEKTYTAKSGRKYGNYTQLMALTKETSAPELLKMDIEGWEWEVLPSLLRTGVSRDIMPRQIAFELHVRTFPAAEKIAPPSFWRAKTPGEVTALMAMLFAHNYVLIDRRDNAACPHCSEIVVADICTRDGDRTATKRRAVSDVS
jgi:hypothetical protein